MIGIEKAILAILNCEKRLKLEEICEISSCEGWKKVIKHDIYPEVKILIEKELIEGNIDIGFKITERGLAYVEKENLTNKKIYEYYN